MEDFKLSEDGKSLIKYKGHDAYVIIPDGVEIIEGHSFVKCESITSVKLPSSIKTIQKMAFYKCEFLSDVIIPETKVECTGCSFCCCPNLKLSSNIINGELVCVPKQTKGKFVIPQDVKKITDGAFCGCHIITEIIIPDGVESIGKKAFNECHSITEINFPSSVKDIHEGAIIDCKNLMYLSVDKNNEIYDSRDNCNAVIETATNTIRIGCLKTQFPESVTTIGKSAFSSSDAVLTIPCTITKIEIGAFEACDKLKKVIFEEGYNKPNYWAFTGCKNLQQIVLPESYESIEDWLENDEGFDFDYDDSMMEIEDYLDKPIFNSNIFVRLPTRFKGEYIVQDGITHIEPYACSSCSELTSITLPATVKSIGKYAFAGCTKLQSINIPRQTRIESDAFNNCGSLRTTIISGDKLFRVSRNEKHYVIENNISSIEKGAFLNCNELVSVVIPDSITKIDSTAFEGCISLESIVIPNSVKEIGNSIFKGCKKLQHIVLPNSLSDIPSQAFCDCESLQEMILPDNITKIASCSFQNCTSLRQIIVTSNLEEIGNCAFENCSSLKHFFTQNIDQLNSRWKIIYDGISIPKTVTRIGDSAFAGCSAANGLDFQAKFSLIEIGKSAFKGCKSIKMVYLPEGLKDIKESTFEDCESLGLISVPYATRTIHTTAFEGCKNIIIAELPSGWDSKREILGLPPARRSYDCDSLGQSPDGKMIYTRGRFSPCPYCGYDGTTTYIDGTAQCNHCKCWFRYEYP